MFLFTLGLDCECNYFLRFAGIGIYMSVRGIVEDYSIIKFIAIQKRKTLWEGIWGGFYAVSTTRARNAYTFVWFQQRPLLIFCYSR